MLNKTLNRSLTRRRNDDGFTLIELLVVVVILGILIGIAIPVYLNYRKSANDKAAQSDVRNAISTLEVCNSDGGYPTAIVAVTFALTNCGGGTTSTQVLSTSSGTTMKYTITPTAAAAGAVTSYILAATNSGGSGKVYCYNSANGGSVAAVASGTALSAATC
jgi:type IV pilus assembly protein PilA